MDWGLVLASQGISAIIDEGADGPGWGLVVAASDYPNAMEAIRLYRLENRHWRWRQPLPWRGVVFDWRVGFWGILMVMFYFLSQMSRPDFQAAGCMNNSAVLAGEWWRIFSAMLLHANVGHLAANVSLGMVLLGLAMGRFGTGMGLLAAFLAGAGGNVAGLLLYPASHLGVGASGMVMGGLGMLAAQSVQLVRSNSLSRANVLKGVLGGVMLFAFFGLSPDADVIAHLGGFVTGLLLGVVLLSTPAAWQNYKTDMAAAIGFIGLLVTTSWLAFR